MILVFTENPASYAGGWAECAMFESVEYFLEEVAARDFVVDDGQFVWILDLGKNKPEKMRIETTPRLIPAKK